MTDYEENRLEEKKLFHLSGIILIAYQRAFH